VADDATGGGAGLDEVLMTLVINFLFFLEHADPEDMAPEAAERMAQEIAFQLARVDPHELTPLVQFIHQQAAASAWPAEREFLGKLPGYLGWE
jgi:hypothetical protein